MSTSKVKAEVFLSDKQIAERWACSATLVRRARYAGLLRTTRIGGVARVALSAVVAYEQSRTEGAEA